MDDSASSGQMEQPPAPDREEGEKTSPDPFHEGEKTSPDPFHEGEKTAPEPFHE
jgi:hypothetical protein